MAELCLGHINSGWSYLMFFKYSFSCLHFIQYSLRKYHDLCNVSLWLPFPRDYQWLLHWVWHTYVTECYNPTILWEVACMRNYGCYDRNLYPDKLVRLHKTKCVYMLCKLIIEIVHTKLCWQKTSLLTLQHRSTFLPLGNLLPWVTLPRELCLLWLYEQGISYQQMRDDVEVIDELPFSTDRKYMATLVRSASVPGKNILYLKGATDIIRQYCKSLVGDTSWNEVLLNCKRGKARLCVH